MKEDKTLVKNTHKKKPHHPFYDLTHCLRRDYSSTGCKFLSYANKCFLVSIAFSEMDMKCIQIPIGTIQEFTLEAGKVDSAMALSLSRLYFSHP